MLEKFRLTVDSPLGPLPNPHGANPSGPWGEDAASGAAVLSGLTSCLAVVPVLATQLQEVMGEIETGILGISGSFEDMARRAREAVSGVFQDDSTTAAKDSRTGITHLVRETRETLGRLLQRVEQTSRISAATVRRMKEIERRMNSLNRTLCDIDEIAKNARLLAINGQIEAARAGAHGAAFSVVATETANMAKHAMAASQNMREIIGTLSAEIAAGSVELRDRAAADTEDAARSRAEVNGTLDTMALIHDEMQTAMEQARENSRSLARDIGQAVVALQFQDAVSQRIGHVVQTLQDVHGAVQSILGGGPPAGSPPADNGAPARDWTVQMADRYTMASERQTLAASTSRQARNARDPRDNVELF
ncbi:MAG: hypothetical protein HUU20_13575 [Pirellulales bacterium]|nr:hypothetical protein [Pirellulales bacterium]